MSVSHRTDSTHHRDVAEAAWRWVLTQLRWDGGPQLAECPDPRCRNGFHSGIGGLAYVLAEIRLSREWTAAEKRLADAITEQLTNGIATETDYTFFNGLVSTVGVLTVLGAAGAEDAVRRLRTLATPTGWPQTSHVPPKYLPDTRVTDIVLGTAGILLGAVWAHRGGVPGARELGELAAGVLVDEAETVPTGVNWQMVPPRFRTEPGRVLPNFSHGLAGVATALALAGTELDRPDLTDTATRGAAHLVTLGTTDGATFTVPHLIPNAPTTSTSHTTGVTAVLAPRCCSSPSTGPASSRSRGTRRSRGTAGACTASARRACQHAGTRASGTTTGAAAARPVSATPSWTPGNAAGLRATSPSHCTSRTPSSSGPSTTARTPTGGSSSTASPSRCCHPA